MSPKAVFGALHEPGGAKGEAGRDGGASATGDNYRREDGQHGRAGHHCAHTRREYAQPFKNSLPLFSFSSV